MISPPSISSLKVGVITGGGDCPGLNAVIRAVTRSLIQDEAQVIGFQDGFTGLIDNRSQVLDWPTVEAILPLGGTILGTSNRANPLAAPQMQQQLLQTIALHGLGALVAIGGDGTLSIASTLFKAGVPVVGVPKTIDNDIEGCERSFGFDSAVATVVQALEQLRTTGQSHGRTMILETMGRYSGWIALEAGIAGRADVILLPEIDYELDKIVAICRQRQQARQSTLICIAEGAKIKGGELTIAQHLKDRYDTIRLGGVAHVLREQLQDHLDQEVRSLILGHLQRGAAPTAFDRVLATQYGAKAAQLVKQQQWGQVVTLAQGQLSHIPLEQVEGRHRKVPLNHSLIATAQATGISLGI